MEQRQLEGRMRLVPYKVTREYKLFGSDMKQATMEIIASVSFLPSNYKTYSIEKITGSAHGEKVVKQVLEREAEYAKRGTKIPISRQDYDFRDLGEQDLNARRCYVLQTISKRRDKDLLDGKVYVDAVTYEIRRFEGEPAKGPSWWLKNLKIVMNFSEVDGMWLQTSSMGTADVRLFGKHTLLARDIRYQTAREVAQKSLTQASQK